MVRPTHRKLFSESLHLVSGCPVSKVCPCTCSVPMWSGRITLRSRFRQLHLWRRDFAGGRRRTCRRKENSLLALAPTLLECHLLLQGGLQVQPAPVDSAPRSHDGSEMRNLRQRAALRKRHQPRQQHAAPPLESEFAERAGIGEWRAQAVARLHVLHTFGPCEEGCLRGSFLLAVFR